MYTQSQTSSANIFIFSKASEADWFCKASLLFLHLVAWPSFVPNLPFNSFYCSLLQKVIYSVITCLFKSLLLHVCQKEEILLHLNAEWVANYFPGEGYEKFQKLYLLPVKWKQLNEPTHSGLKTGKRMQTHTVYSSYNFHSKANTFHNILRLH